MSTINTVQFLCTIFWLNTWILPQPVKVNFDCKVMVLLCPACWLSHYSCHSPGCFFERNEGGWRTKSENMCFSLFIRTNCSAQPFLASPVRGLFLAALHLSVSFSSVSRAMMTVLWGNHDLRERFSALVHGWTIEWLVELSVLGSSPPVLCTPIRWWCYPVCCGSIIHSRSTWIATCHIR